jgi:hypothetical protein
MMAFRREEFITKKFGSGKGLRIAMLDCPKDGRVQCALCESSTGSKSIEDLALYRYLTNEELVQYFLEA